MFSALTTTHERKFLHEHVNLFVALGPVVYMGNVEGPLKLLSDYVDEVEAIASFLKIHKVGSYDGYGSEVRDRLVNLKSEVKQKSIENIIVDTLMNFSENRALDLLSEFIFSWTEAVMGTTEYDNLKSSFSHDMPAGFRTTLHFGQMIKSQKFMKYDYGTSLRNGVEYSSLTPPEMHPENIRVPMMLVNAYDDTLSTVDDVEKLIDTLNPNYLVKSMTIQGGHSTFQQAKDMSWFQDEVIPVVQDYNPVI